jgi:serpin B
MMKHAIHPLAQRTAAAVLLMAACGEDANPRGSELAPDTVSSNLERVRNPEPTAEQMRALARGNHRFTLDLFGQLDGDENAMISTLSIRTAFAMVYAGARTTTAQAMSDWMYMDSDAEAFHQAMNALDLALADRELPADPEQDLDPVELRQANAFWSQTGYPWKQDYLDTLARHYGAGVYTVDFWTQPEISRRTINDWVEKRTRERIQDLLPEGSIKTNTVAVLTNAIYFKAPWSSVFDENFTQSGDFERKDGSTSSVEYMKQVAEYGHAEGAGWVAVELPFRGEDLSMVIVAPDAGTFDGFKSSMTAEALRNIVDSLSQQQVELSLPKFEFETQMQLSESFRNLGLAELFEGPDLSGMVEGRLLSVDEAYHKTFVAVDEKGTEAAAATAVVIVETSAPTPDHTVALDRPFLFLIRDRATGVWLFFGQVLDPSA